MPKTIAIFCGSSTPKVTSHLDHTARIAHDLAADGNDLIYGGSKSGLMGLVAETFLSHGRKVEGVTPEGLLSELVHPQGANVRYVRDMFERKQRFMDVADAFVILPGGWGTLDELTEVLTHRYFADVAPKVQYTHRKPTIMVSYDETEQLLISYLQARQRQGYIHPLFNEYLFTGRWDDCFAYLKQQLAVTEPLSA